MSLQHASRRRAAIEETLQVKAMTPFPHPQVAPVLGRCSLREVDGRRYQGIHASERRLCCVSRTRSSPEPPGHDRGTRTRRMIATLRWRSLRPRTDTARCPIWGYQIRRQKSVHGEAPLLAPPLISERRGLHQLDPHGMGGARSAFRSSRIARCVSLPESSRRPGMATTG